jgi:hypothetical protein
MNARRTGIESHLHHDQLFQSLIQAELQHVVMVISSIEAYVAQDPELRAAACAKE